MKMAIRYHKFYNSAVLPTVKVVGGQQTDGNLIFIFLALLHCLTGTSCGIFVFLAVVSFFTSTELLLQSDVEKGRQLMAALVAKKKFNWNLSHLQVCVSFGGLHVLKMYDS
jgi:hypothetical protein